jgi:FAD:protein FMN transferase
MGAHLHQVAFRAMGTDCVIAVTPTRGEEELARQALDAGVGEVAACEHVLSRFDAASDLSKLNRAGGEWVTVDRRLVGALGAALRARATTGGRFDPTILPALMAAGYDRTFTRLEVRAATVAASWHPDAMIDVDPTAGRVRLERGAAVDLGGIGKGWSADSAVRAIRRLWPSLAGCLVDLGGDIAVWGVAPVGGPWLIDVADPTHPGSRLATIRLATGGVATSGRNTRRFGPDSRLHHLIDPTTGAPSDVGPLTVTVVAHNAAEAEAHATALAISPPSEAGAYLAGRPGLAALLVPAAGAPVALGDLPLVAERRRVHVNLATAIGGLR